jgi:hypothetical protein
VYTPITFITFVGVIWFLVKKQYYLFFSWFFFFSIVTYFLSAWWCWNYGCSYGLRAYIDFYTVFFIPMALFLNERLNGFRILICLASLLTIPINIIQTYQYKVSILHWGEMDKEKYWEIFLKTEDNLRGLVWKKKYDFSNYQVVKKIKWEDFSTTKNHSNLIGKIQSSEIPEFDKVSIIQVTFDHEFNEKDCSQLVLTINDLDSNTNCYYHNPNLIFFSNHQLNHQQKGDYNYEFKPIETKSLKEITLILEKEKSKIELKNVEILFLKNK